MGHSRKGRESSLLDAGPASSRRCSLQTVLSKMQRSPFAIRRDSPFPSRALYDDLLQQRSGSTSNTTSFGLTAGSRALSTAASRGRLFVPSEFPADTEFTLLKIDGLASCWHPERKMMVPMLFCVWDDFPGDWQPLECVPPTMIIEWTRRSMLGSMHLMRMLEDEPRDWVSKHPDPESLRVEDRAYTTFPGQKEHNEGNVPREPEPPSKVFTSAEIFLGDSTARKFERYYQEDMPYPSVVQVLHNAVEGGALSMHLSSGCSLTVNIYVQTVRENHGTVVGETDTVRAVNIHNVAEAGVRVVTFGDNCNYNADLAGQ